MRYRWFRDAYKLRIARNGCGIADPDNEFMYSIGDSTCNGKRRLPGESASRKRRYLDGTTQCILKQLPDRGKDHSLNQLLSFSFFIHFFFEFLRASR